MDDVILNKIASIENCLNRIREEYEGYEDELETNYAKQDSITLNLQRACEAALDLGTRTIHINNLGLPQESRDVFIILQKSKVIPPEVSKKMQAMVGFRNIAMHDQKINFVIVRAILKSHLHDFRNFIKCICK